MIISFMPPENLLIPSRSLSFGMMITNLLRYFETDISSKTTFAPSVNINRTLIKRMQVGSRERAMFLRNLLTFILAHPPHLSKPRWIWWILLSLVLPLPPRKFLQTKRNLGMTSLIFAHPSPTVQWLHLLQERVAYTCALWLCSAFTLFRPSFWSLDCAFWSDRCLPSSCWSSWWSSLCTWSRFHRRTWVIPSFLCWQKGRERIGVEAFGRS